MNYGHIVKAVTSSTSGTKGLPDIVIYLNINQLDALNFIMNLCHASTCFKHMCSSSGLHLPSTAQRSEKLPICSKTQI